jgi:hypothetical protein
MSPGRHNDDVRKGARVTDTLKTTELSAVVIPKTDPFNETDIASFRELYLYSQNPGGPYILSPESGPGIIEMGRVWAGSRATSSKPSAAGLHGLVAFEALVFAEAACPSAPRDGGVSGATGPMSVWGTCVLELAEVTGTNVVIYALTGNSQLSELFQPHMDLRTRSAPSARPRRRCSAWSPARWALYGGRRLTLALSDACCRLPVRLRESVQRALRGALRRHGIGCHGMWARTRLSWSSWSSTTTGGRLQLRAAGRVLDPDACPSSRNWHRGQLHLRGAPLGAHAPKLLGGPVARSGATSGTRRRKETPDLYHAPHVT